MRGARGVGRRGGPALAAALLALLLGGCVGLGAAPTPGAARPATATAASATEAPTVALPTAARVATAAPTVARTATAAPTVARAATAAPTVATGDEVAAAEVVALLNARRAEAGCAAPLEPAAELMAAAARHSRDMAAGGFLDHLGSDGSDAGRRIVEAGYTWAAGPGPVWAENLAAGYDDPVALVEGWMASEGHRETILTCAFRAVGVALARAEGGPYGTYWTAVFAVEEG